MEGDEVAAWVTPKCFYKWDNLKPRGSILYGSTYLTFCDRKIYRSREEFSGCQVLGGDSDQTAV